MRSAGDRCSSPWACPGIVFGGLVYFTVREPKRGRLDAAGDGTKPSLIETAKFLWSQRAACHLMLGSAVTALWGWGLTWWTPAFLMRNYALTLGQAGDITGPSTLVGGIAATGVHGLAARPTVHVRPAPRGLVSRVAALRFATVPSIVIFCDPLARALTKIMFWIFIPFIYFYIGPCFGILNNLSPPRMRGQFCAVTLLVANVGNLIIAPQLVGALSDLFRARPRRQRGLAAPGAAVPGANRVLVRVPLFLVHAHAAAGAGTRDWPCLTNAACLCSSGRRPIEYGDRMKAFLTAWLCWGSCCPARPPRTMPRNCG